MLIYIKTKKRNNSIVRFNVIKKVFKLVLRLFKKIIFFLRRGKGNTGDFDYVLLKRGEKNKLSSKLKPNVFIVNDSPYYKNGGHQRSSLLAKGFNDMGFNVIYLYDHKISNNVFSYIFKMISAHIFIDDKSLKKIKKRISSNDLFVFCSLSEKAFKVFNLALADNCKIVYDFNFMLYDKKYDDSFLMEILKKSCLLVGSNDDNIKDIKLLLKKYEINNKNILKVEDAIDHSVFNNFDNYVKPKDLVVDKVTFLYFGLLSCEVVDWNLLIELANNKRYSFNIIGDYSKLKFTSSCPSNIHFLGEKAYYDLPSYLKYVDYVIFPFKKDFVNKQDVLLNLLASCAMNKRILCTNSLFTDGILNSFVGSNCSDLEAIIKKNYQINKEGVDKFTINNMWCNRVESILDILFPSFNESFFKDKLSIVVLNYNNKNVIFKCIDSLIRFGDIYNYEIIVVDNGSTDGSWELLKTRYKDKIKLIQNIKNGCSSGRNLGVTLSTREYLLFLDSDQFVANKYWLLPYENVLKSSKNVGAIGWAAGFFNYQCKAYYTNSDYFYKYMPCSYLCRYDIGYLGTGGMLVSKKDFEVVDGFDLAYDPTCYEDVDFSLKIRNIGKKLYFCPYLGVIHFPHQTTKSGSKSHCKLMKKKQDYFIKKWKKKNKRLFKYKKNVAYN